MTAPSGNDSADGFAELTRHFGAFDIANAGRIIALNVRLRPNCRVALTFEYASNLVELEFDDVSHVGVPQGLAEDLQFGEPVLDRNATVDYGRVRLVDELAGWNIAARSFRVRVTAATESGPAAIDSDDFVTRDQESGDTLWVGVRRTAKNVRLALSLEASGDIEVFLDETAAQRIARAFASPVES